MIKGECRIEVKFLTDLQIDLAVILEPFNTDLWALKVSKNRDMAIQLLADVANPFGTGAMLISRTEGFASIVRGQLEKRLGMNFKIGHSALTTSFGMVLQDVKAAVPDDPLDAAVTAKRVTIRWNWLQLLIGGDSPLRELRVDHEHAVRTGIEGARDARVRARLVMAGRARGLPVAADAHEGVRSECRVAVGAGGRGVVVDRVRVADGAGERPNAEGRDLVHHGCALAADDGLHLRREVFKICHGPSGCRPASAAAPWRGYRASATGRLMRVEAA